MAKVKQVKKSSKIDEIEIGDQVKHPRFGIGTILYKSGNGDRTKAIVVFAEEGQKKLLLKHAKLKKVKEPAPEEDVSEEEIIESLDDGVDS